MTAALIGLLGIIFGAILGGFASYGVERQRGRDAGKAAGLLIAAELSVAARKLKGAADVRSPWIGMLPTEQRNQHFFELVVILPDEDLERVSAAYAIIDNRNSEGPPTEEAIRAEALGKPGVVPATLQPAVEAVKVGKYGEVEEDANALETARTQLQGAVEGGRPRRYFWRVSAVAAAGIVVLGLCLALFEARPHLTNQSVASSLESVLGVRKTVECRDAPVGWRCNVQTLTGSRAACAGVGAIADASPNRLLAIASPNRLLAIASPCTVVGKDRALNVAEHGRRLLATSAGAERAANRKAIFPQEKKESYFWRAWHYFGG